MIKYKDTIERNKIVETQKARGKSLVQDSINRVYYTHILTPEKIETKIEDGIETVTVIAETSERRLKYENFLYFEDQTPTSP